MTRRHHHDLGHGGKELGVDSNRPAAKGRHPQVRLAAAHRLDRRRVLALKQDQPRGRAAPARSERHRQVAMPGAQLLDEPARPLARLTGEGGQLDPGRGQLQLAPDPPI